MEELVRKAPLRVPTFRGLKFTSMILAEYSQCVSLCNDAKLTILYGCDDVSSATTKFFVPQKEKHVYLFLSLFLPPSLPLSHFSQQILASLALGGYGAVGSTYNFQGNLSARMFRAHAKGDMASALLEQVCRLTLLCVVCALCGSLFEESGFPLWQQRSQSVVSLMMKYGPQCEWGGRG